jgi:hypothetical protein
VQPDKGLEMQSLADGRRVAGGYKVYTDTQIVTARIDGNLQYNPDIIVRNGLQYEAVDPGDFQSDVINHYKVKFVKTESPIELPAPPQSWVTDVGDFVINESADNIVFVP